MDLEVIVFFIEDQVVIQFRFCMRYGFCLSQIESIQKQYVNKLLYLCVNVIEMMGSGFGVFGLWVVCYRVREKLKLWLYVVCVVFFVYVYEVFFKDI